MKTRRQKPTKVQGQKQSTAVHRCASSAAHLQEQLDRRTRELAEAREQQTATSEILRVISSSPTDVQPVFDAIAANALRLCGAKWSVVVRYDGKLMELATLHNLSNSRGQEAMRQSFPRPPGEGATDRAILTRAIVYIPDVLKDPQYQFQRLAQASGYRSILSVPLLRDGQAVGAITVPGEAPGAFSQREADLLQTFADQAVIAIENVRLFDEVQARTEELSESLQQQTATADVLKVISRSTFDLQAVLDTLVESAARLCEADHAWLFRRDGELYRWAASYGHSKKEHQRIKRYMLTFAPSPGRGSVVGRAALEGQPVQIADVLADPEYMLHDVQKISNYRTGLGIPLLREGIPIGVLALSRSQVRPFSDKQIELLTTFADQAVIAIENARLFEAEQQRTRELSESLQQQTATADVLKVISRSTFDLQPVLEALIENATKLCAAEQGFIFRWDGELYHLAADYNAPAGFRDWLHRGGIRPEKGFVVGRVALEDRTIQILDAQADADWRAWNAEAPGTSGVRTLLGVPMRREGVLIGVIAMWRTEVRAFTDNQLAVVETFADQAVIAIENTRLLNELRESLQQQTATADVLKVISRSTFDLQPVLEALTESATRLCGASRGHIFQFDGEFLRFAAAYGAWPGFTDYLDAHPLRPGPGTVAGKAALERHTIHVRDVMEVSGYELPELIKQQGYRTVLAVPMLREGALRGVITILKTNVEPFADKQIELVETFADQAVIAIENVRLFDEVQARTRELSESLEQQTATSEVLQVISSSPGELRAFPTHVDT